MSNSDFTVLFICTGSTCRSPIAEQLFNVRTKDLSAHAFSAGLSAKPGLPINPHAAVALINLGYTPTEHNSVLVSTEAVEEADVILTFTQDQKNELAQKFPAAVGKLFTVSEFANRETGISVDISDPYGRSAEAYRETADTISALVGRIVGSLKTN